MFAKLLKHEWRGSRKTVGLLCAVILVSGALIGISALGLIYMTENTGNNVLFVLLSILMVVCVITVALSCGASLFYALWRFYRSRFTEEGYLTYTLPVSHHQLLLSSILVSIWDILLTVLSAFAAVLLALGIASLAFPWQELGKADWAKLWASVGQMLYELSPHMGEILGVLLMIALMCLSQLLLLMLAVTIGAMVAKKHPILMAVVVYYGVMVLRSVVFAGFLASAMAKTFGSALAVMDLSSFAVAAGSYLAIYYLTSRKLNIT